MFLDRWPLLAEDWWRLLGLSAWVCLIAFFGFRLVLNYLNGDKESCLEGSPSKSKLMLGILICALCGVLALYVINAIVSSACAEQFKALEDRYKNGPPLIGTQTLSLQFEIGLKEHLAKSS